MKLCIFEKKNCLPLIKVTNKRENDKFFSNFPVFSKIETIENGCDRFKLNINLKYNDFIQRKQIKSWHSCLFCQYIGIIKYLI